MKNQVLHFYQRLCWQALADWLGPHDTEERPGEWARKSALLRRANLKIGRDVIVMSGLNSLISLNQNISIGDHCVIGPGARIWCFNRVTIGAFTVIGAGVALVNGGHDINTFEPVSGPLEIGRGCRIGHGCKIVRPVTIGDRAEIEPGAIVTADVPAASIVAGVPAKVVGQVEETERKWLWGSRFFSPQNFEIIA